MVYWCSLVVSIIYKGMYDEEYLKILGKNLDTDKIEGFVVRLAGSFSYGAFRKSITKWVRANHVQTTHGWKYRQLVKNVLK